MVPPVGFKIRVCKACNTKNYLLILWNNLMRSSFYNIWNSYMWDLYILWNKCFTKLSYWIVLFFWCIRHEETKKKKKKKKKEKIQNFYICYKFKPYKFNYINLKSTFVKKSYNSIYTSLTSLRISRVQIILYHCYI